MAKKTAMTTRANGFEMCLQCLLVIEAGYDRMAHLSIDHKIYTCILNYFTRYYDIVLD